MLVSVEKFYWLFSIDYDCCHQHLQNVLQSESDNFNVLRPHVIAWKKPLRSLYASAIPPLALESGGSAQPQDQVYGKFSSSSVDCRASRLLSF
jgi:hypothetical protein